MKESCQKYSIFVSRKRSAYTCSLIKSRENTCVLSYWVIPRKKKKKRHQYVSSDWHLSSAISRLDRIREEEKKEKTSICWHSNKQGGSQEVSNKHIILASFDRQVSALVVAQTRPEKFDKTPRYMRKQRLRIMHALFFQTRELRLALLAGRPGHSLSRRD